MVDSSTELYRYDIQTYAITGSYEWNCDEVVGTRSELNLTVFGIVKETPKGYWYCQGQIETGRLKSFAKWVNKTSKKRYCYPTKDEALISFVYRQKARIRILQEQINRSKSVMEIAESYLKQEVI